MEEAITFKTYSSNIYGFSIDYPDKWLISENNSFFVVGFRESNEETFPSFNIQIIDLTMFGPNVNYSSFEEMIRSQILRVGAKAGAFTDEKVGDFNGRSIIFYIPENHMKSKQTYFFNKGNAYLISYTSKADDYFIKHLFVHDHAISSFALFESKGYKFLQLKSTLAQLTSDDRNPNQSLFMEYYTPKNWVEKKISKESIKYTDNENKGNSLLVHIKQVKKDDSEDSSTPLPSPSLEHADNKEEHISLVFQMDFTIICFTFSTPINELNSWRSCFNRIIEYFGLINKQNKKAKDNVPYDYFDNLIIGYSFRVPKSFQLTACKPNGEYVSFKDSDETKNPIPYCFRVLVEDLTDYPGQLKLYEYSNEVVSKLLEQPEAKLLTEEAGFIRLDKHLAQTSSMQSYDVEIQQPALRLIVTSVQKNHGIVLTVRTLFNQFDNIYKKSFYVFDTFNFYKLNKN
ncbi:hypothetical protein DICPUDRAFT_28078 [Dictyostelium purpureum]|uniref:Uncharacterized protein n=1 Tax=Dictyostelium purpureum TaxID=5786 RepID=F0ZB71_DICPU|nr:uncharacterized protein DICPUDRAFT_28078 [Dictyostelium purpureum]EGC38791.1 hypothetical protein DICPUDRAFT_28078 [Dictyostelium purpureum]|eukprot:XP_003284685.1 hypothetical protein DICPUDRAFT_28078 [Dictyostelium purpureum]